MNPLNSNLRRHSVAQQLTTRGIQPGSAQNIKRPDTAKPGEVQKSFGQVLNQAEQKINPLQFSKHAAQRLEARSIHLTSGELQRLDGALDKAAAKGIREALIMMEDKVFIAHVKSKTIITASTEQDLKENVFTQIDGAVIV